MHQRKEKSPRDEKSPRNEKSLRNEMNLRHYSDRSFWNCVNVADVGAYEVGTTGMFRK